MRKEEFAEALGEINEKHILEARVERKAKKPVWLKWGAMAACLCLVVSFFVIPDLTEDPDVVHPMLQPVTFYSTDEFVESVKNADSKDDANYLWNILYYYVPSEAITDITLDSIMVSERYVCMYYHLKELSRTNYSSADEEEIARISNTVKFEWVRNADGDALLANTIEQLSLEQLKGGIYYCDISYPTQPNVILAKSLFWVYDGYMFNLDLPEEVYTSLIAEYGVADVLTTVHKVPIEVGE